MAGAFGALASIGGVWILLVLLCFHKKTQSAINARINAVDINVKDVNSDKTNQGEPILATTDNQQNTTPPTPPGNFVHRPAPTPPSFIPPILNPEDKDVGRFYCNFKVHKEYTKVPPARPINSGIVYKNQYWCLQKKGR